jgi:hypothetical protein
VTAVGRSEPHDPLRPDARDDICGDRFFVRERPACLEGVRRIDVWIPRHLHAAAVPEEEFERFAAEARRLHVGCEHATVGWRKPHDRHAAAQDRLARLGRAVDNRGLGRAPVGFREHKRLGERIDTGLDNDGDRVA